MCRLCTDEGDRASCMRCGCTICLDAESEETCHEGCFVGRELFCLPCASLVEDLELLDAADELLADEFLAESIDWDEYEYGLSPDGYPVEPEEWW